MLVGFGTLGAIIAGVIFPAFSLAFGTLINEINTPGGDFMGSVVNVSKILLYMGVAMAIGGYLAMACFLTTSERQSKRVREAYLAALLKQEVAWHDLQSTGDLAVKITSETRKFQDGLGDKLAQVVQQSACFVAGFGIALFKGWQLTFVILAFVPLLILCGALMSFVMAGSNAVEQKSDGDAGALASEAIGGVRTVAGLQFEDNRILRYLELTRSSFAAAIRKGWFQGAAIGSFVLVIFSVYGFGLWYGATLIRDGTDRWPGKLYSGGDVMAIFYALLIGVMGISQAAPHFSAIVTARCAAGPLFALIDRKSKIDSLDATTGHQVETVTGGIRLDNVVFTYPSRPETRILKNLSVTFAAGQTIALVGASGCGKSTIMQLVERFYDPDQERIVSAAEAAVGEVDANADGPFVPGQVFVQASTATDATVREYDLRDLNVSSWRSHIGMVAQEPVLFAGTVADNIRYGKPGATDSEIIAAATAANAHGFVSKMNKGYDTFVGEGGRLLSGGQKQRIAIARALIKNPSILLLDEATSALDTESERIVQKALDKIVGNKAARRTTLVIAHRLSTIKDADRIIVFDAGRIVEDGTHASLLSAGGPYARMVNAHEGESEAPAADEAGEYDEVDEEMNDPAAAEPSVSLVAEHSVTGDIRVNIIHSEASKTGAAPAGTARDSENAACTPKKSGMPGLFRYARGHWKPLCGGIVAGLAEGTAFPVYALLLGTMTDSLYRPHDEMMGVVKDYAVWFFLLGLGAFFAALIRSGLLQLAGEHLVLEIRNDLFDSIMRQEIGFHDEEANSAGILQTKLSADAVQIRNVITFRLATVTTVVANVISGFAIAFARGWNMALIMLVVFPALGGAGIAQYMLLMGFGSASKAAIESAGQVATESVTNIRTLASFNGEAALLKRFSNSLAEGLHVGQRSAQIAGIGMAAANFVNFASYALAFWYGGRLVYRNELKFEAFIVAFSSVEIASMMVGQLFQVLPDLEKVSAAMADVFAIIERKSNLDYKDPSGETPPIPCGEITFDNVHFHYPTRPNVKVLRGLSFTAAGNKTLAIVGESGSGKSTVFGLIQRFYDPVRAIDPELTAALLANPALAAQFAPGSVMIDGHDMRTLRLSHLRYHLGIVGQEPMLFAGTIADNVRCGDESITDEQVEAACKLANMHDLIVSRFPRGYKTQVGPKGSQLSGGQKQRVAIARAIVREPKVLLLDEATSALDSRSERLVQDALNRAMQGRTTILIAHRLDTVKKADAIIVVVEGKVVEGPGTHDELAALGGRYANLVAAASMSGGKIEEKKPEKKKAAPKTGGSSVAPAA
jgi:ATP-binding cassette subfamily B (MDR/TAP) protein 1